MSSNKVSPQKKRPPRKTSASNSKRAQRKKINRYVRICGRILFILQVIISLIMLFTVGRTGMLPWKYMVLIFAVLALLAAVTFMLNLKRNRKVRLTGIGISTVVIIFVLVFTRYFNRTMGLISSGDNAQKTDNMVVVVRANDPAEVLMDAKEYKFAVHGASSGASGEMISDVESAISSKIKVEEYSSDVEAARALLEGKADAAIYNKAYTSIIAESLDDDEYEDRVRVLYQYGIQTSIEKETVTELRPLVAQLSQVHLDELADAINHQEPCPGSQEILSYFKERGSYLRPLLGEGGDPAFSQRIRSMVHEVVAGRALDGIDLRAVGAFFDYYLTFAISAEVGVLLRWLEGGMRESVRTMARIMTALMFVRPGDLYDSPIELDLPSFALAVTQGALGIMLFADLYKEWRESK